MLTRVKRKNLSKRVNLSSKKLFSGDEILILSPDIIMFKSFVFSVQSSLFLRVTFYKQTSLKRLYLKFFCGIILKIVYNY